MSDPQYYDYVSPAEAATKAEPAALNYAGKWAESFINNTLIPGAGSFYQLKFRWLVKRFQSPLGITELQINVSENGHDIYVDGVLFTVSQFTKAAFLDIIRDSLKLALSRGVGGAYVAVAVQALDTPLGASIASTVISLGWDALDVSANVLLYYTGFEKTYIDMSRNGSPIRGVVFKAGLPATQQLSETLRLFDQTRLFGGSALIGDTATVRRGGRVEGNYLVKPGDLVAYGSASMQMSNEQFYALQATKSSGATVKARDVIFQYSDKTVVEADASISLRLAKQHDQTAIVKLRLDEVAFGAADITDKSIVILGGNLTDALQARLDRSTTIYGAGGSDVINGSLKGDFIFGDYDTTRPDGGIDIIHAAAGNDYVNGGGDNDQIYGEEDDDTLEGSSGADQIYGGSGDDRLFSVVDGTSDGDTAGDTLDGGIGADYILGSKYDDLLIGSGDSDRDRLFGDKGFDTYNVGNRDIILDADGSGAVIFDGITLKGLEPSAPCSFSYGGVKGKFGEVYSRYGKLLVVSYHGDQISIRDWTNGQLGINLDVSGSGGCPKLPPLVRRAQIDPLVLDLGSTGFDLTSVTTSQVYFNLEQNGFAQRTGWVGATNGMLALDKNHNGVIDDVGELFGTATTDGFDVLTGFDSNSDGVINVLDAQFAELLVWQDLNVDGITDAGELNTLAYWNVAEISLAVTPFGATVEGNSIPVISQFTRTDGSTGNVGSVYFAVDQQTTRYVRPEGFTISPLAQTLPVFTGFGIVADSDVVFTLDPALASGFSTFLSDSSGQTLTSIRAQFEPLFGKIAGVDFDTMDPASRGPNVDARHLAVLEALNNQQYYRFNSHGDILGFDPPPGLGAEFEAGYKEYLDSALFATAVQAAKQSVAVGAPTNSWSCLSVLTYDRTLNQVVGDLSQVFALGEAYEPTGHAELLSYWQDVIANLRYAVRDFAYSSMDVLNADMLEAANAITNQAVQEIVATYINGAVLSARGTPGDDVLTAANQASISEVVFANTGDDQIISRATELDPSRGETAYTYFSGDGNDVFQTNISEGNGADKLAFADLRLQDVEISRDNNDIVVIVKATHQIITIRDGLGWRQTNEGNALDVLALADKSFTSAELRDYLVSDSVESAGDLGHLDFGTNKSDSFASTKGDDILIGGVGDDRYFFDRGAGDDVVVEASVANQNTLYFGPTLSLEDLVWTRQSDDLVIKIKGGNDSITIRGTFLSFMPTQIQTFVLGDGTQLSLDQVRSLIPYDGPGNDIIHVNMVVGSDAVVNSGSGNDVYTISSTINEGHVAVRTYVFEAGFGHDIIGGTAGATANIVSFGSSIDPSTVSVQRFGTHFIFNIAGSGDRLVFFDAERFNHPNDTDYALQKQGFSLQQVVFSDGTVWVAEQLWQTAPAVQELNLPGTQSQIDYNFASGSAHISNDSGNWIASQSLSLRLHGVSSADLVFQRLSYPVVGDSLAQGASVLLSLKGSPSTSLLIDSTLSYSFGVSEIVFDDGSVWSREYIHAYLSQQAMTAGDDSVFGFDTIGSNKTSNDILIGGEGDDYLNGGSGADTYVYSRGDGFDRIDFRTDGGVEGALPGELDTLIFGDIKSTDVTLQRVPGDLDSTDLGSSYEDLIINIDGGVGQPDGQIRLMGQFSPITVRPLNPGIDNIVFSDGVVWNHADIVAKLIAQQETTVDDTIVGFNGADTLEGGLGNDHLSGGVGSDTYVWSWGDGRDYVQDSGTKGTYSDFPAGFSLSVDRVVLHGVNPSEVAVIRSAVDGVSLELVMRGDRSQSIVLRNQTVSSVNLIEQVMFDDGTIWTPVDLLVKADAIQLGSVPTIVGTLESESIEGTAGNDVIDGSAGDDTLALSLGNDTYLFGIGSGHDQIIDSNFHFIYDNSYNKVSTVKLVNLNRSDVDFVNTGGSDIIRIKATNETLTVETGLIERFVFADGQTLLANEVQAHATFIGTAAAETLDIGYGANYASRGRVFEGRGGTDTIWGTIASDTYVWQTGDGNDVIHEERYSPTEPVDTIWLKNVAPSDVSLAFDGQDLKITVVSTGEIITVSRYYTGGVEAIKFGDGTIMNRDAIIQAADLNAAGLNLVGTASDDYLFGEAHDDQITAGAGADTVYGQGGNDEITGGTGDDFLVGGLGTDRYHWKKGDGNDTIAKEYVETVGVDQLLLEDAAASDVVLTVRVDTSSGVPRFWLDVAVASTGETISIQGLENGDFVVQQIIFADGSSLDTRTAVTLPQVAPVAFDDYLADGVSGQIYSIDPASLLFNDVDANADPLVITGLSDAFGGVASLQPDGSISFEPEAGFTGYANFAYTVSDGTSSSIAYAYFYVGEAPSPFATENADYLVASTDDDTIDGLAGDDAIYANGGNDTLIGGLGNDYLDGGSGNDSLSGDAGTNTLFGADGSDTYHIASNPGGLDVVDDRFGNSEDINTIVFESALVSEISLSRISSWQGDNLEIAVAGTGQVIRVISQFGESSGQGIQQIVFADGTVWDRNQIALQLLASGNHAPITTANIESATGRENRVLYGILTPGTDIDHDTLTFKIVAGSAQHGVVTLLDAATGRYMFVPAAGYTGSATFQYVVSDGIADSAPKSVDLSFDFVNTRPVANDDAGLVATQNVPLTISSATLLANDTDANGDTLAISNVRGIAGGTATVSADGNIIFTPQEGFVGAARLVYTVSDGASGFATATVSLNVLAATGGNLQAIDDVATAPEDTATVIAVLANDVNPTGGTLTITSASVMHGMATINANGTITYIGNLNYNGADTITYTIDNGSGETATAHVSVAVTALNDLPVANLLLALTTQEDNSVEGAINAVDVDGDTISYRLKAGAGASKGVVDLRADGTFTYHPDANASGPDTFVVQYWSCTCGTFETVVTVDIAPINDAPVVTGVVFGAATEDETAVSIDALANISDADTGDVLSVVGLPDTLPAGVAFIAATHTFSLDPANAAYQDLSAGEVQLVTVNYAVTDGTDTLAAAATFTVTGTNDVPTATADAGFATLTNTTLTINAAALLANDTDADAQDVLTIESVQGASHGTVAMAANGNVLFTAEAGYAGAAGFTYTVTDGNGGSSTAQAELTITPNIINGTSLADTLTGTAGADLISAGAGNDTISADAGNDVLDGGLGADKLIGGLGNDTFMVDNVGDSVTEVASAGIDTILSSVSYTAATNVENLTLTGSDAINATGNTLANTITGNAAANILSGGTGADILIGGDGNDTYIVDNTGDIVTELAGGGIDLVQSSVAYMLATNVENLILTGTGSVAATGNELDNVLTGNTGANTLNGGTGADTMLGGLGNDIYVVDSAGDLVVENAGEGTDAVQSSISYTLIDNVENLTLTGTAAINGTGNALNNIITGNSVGNILDGGLGADKLIGGTGDDTFIVDNTGDVVTEAASAGIDTILSSVSFTAATNVEKLILTGGDAINATGNTLANTITGNTAANVLSGGTGADILIGGDGDDAYIVDNIGDVVTEQASQGIDLVRSSVAYTLAANVENLTISGTGSIAATGNELDNILTGNTGNNTLNGGLGADTLIGGLGNEIYVVDSVGDLVIENAGEGTDAVQSSISYTLMDNVENLTLTGTAAINGTGNALNNTITGNAVGNILDGGLGADKLIGGLGDDMFIVDNIGDVVTEAVSAGIDTIQSSVSFTAATNVENLILIGSDAINATGNTLANTITGNTAANILSGGTGADILIGGDGDDIYVVDNIGDVVTEQAGQGIDLVQSSVAYTLAANIENLTLTGTGAIAATGNALDNILTGNTGANTLNGGTGADILFGGAGADNLTGGLDMDTFQFSAGFGKDIITDFTAVGASHDMLQFDPALFADFAAVMAATKQVGADSVITLDTADTITLKGVTMASLTATDFKFG